MTLRRLAALVPCALLLGVTLAERSANACSVLALMRYESSPTGSDDKTAPSAVPGVSVAVNRGEAPSCTGGVCAQTSCDDTGFINLDIEPASDDVTASANLGYELMFVEGSLPDDFDFPSGTYSLQGGALSLFWIDGETNAQEAFDFVMSVAAVDLAGNVGEAIEVRIEDGGGAGGCSVAGAVGSRGVLALGLLGLGLFAGRRRRGR